MSAIVEGAGLPVSGATPATIAESLAARPFVSPDAEAKQLNALQKENTNAESHLGACTAKQKGFHDEIKILEAQLALKQQHARDAVDAHDDGGSSSAASDDETPHATGGRKSKKSVSIVDGRQGESPSSSRNSSKGHGTPKKSLTHSASMLENMKEHNDEANGQISLLASQIKDTRISCAHDKQLGDDAVASLPSGEQDNFKVDDSAYRAFRASATRGTLTGDLDDEFGGPLKGFSKLDAPGKEKQKVRLDTFMSELYALHVQDNKVLEEIKAVERHIHAVKNSAQGVAGLVKGSKEGEAGTNASVKDVPEAILDLRRVVGRKQVELKKLRSSWWSKDKGIQSAVTKSQYVANTANAQARQQPPMQPQQEPSMDRILQAMRAKQAETEGAEADQNMDEAERRALNQLAGRKSDGAALTHFAGRKSVRIAAEAEDESSPYASEEVEGDRIVHAIRNILGPQSGRRGSEKRQSESEGSYSSTDHDGHSAERRVSQDAMQNSERRISESDGPQRMPATQAAMKRMMMKGSEQSHFTSDDDEVHTSPRSTAADRFRNASSRIMKGAESGLLANASTGRRMTVAPQGWTSFASIAEEVQKAGQGGGAPPRASVGRASIVQRPGGTFQAMAAQLRSSEFLMQQAGLTQEEEAGNRRSQPLGGSVVHASPRLSQKKSTAVTTLQFGASASVPEAGGARAVGVSHSSGALQGRKTLAAHGQEWKKDARGRDVTSLQGFPGVTGRRNETVQSLAGLSANLTNWAAVPSGVQSKSAAPNTKRPGTAGSALTDSGDEKG